jgi:molecular chaperone GrpE
MNIYRESVWFLVARPFLVLGVIALGYFAHLVEYQRHITDLDRDTGRTRPRWHYVTICAGGGLLGWFGWVLSQLNVLGSEILPIGVLTWSAGTFGLVYFLHATLLEDRWSYGLQIHSAIWKFPVQYAVGLMLYDGVIGLPGPESNTLAVAIVPLVVGLLYAARRYFAFTERGAAFSGWVRQLTYRWHQMIPWPSTSRFEGRGDSPETDQFGQLEESTRDEHEGDVDGASRLDREEELRQTREWASYLESELHDREEQLQDLEARLAQVRQELQDTCAADSNDGSTADEREDLLTDLFDIRDNFQRALDAETVLEDDAAAEITDGIELIGRQIKSILDREGVQEIDTSGTVDPTRHQVVKTVPATDADPGDIVDVYRLGYRLDDRVLREARVVVAEEPATDEGGDAADDDSQVNRGGGAS